MQGFIRLLVAAALSVGVGTLVGCKSSEVATPGGGRVTTYTLELGWPSATASRPKDCCTPSAAPSSPARKYVASTPPAPASVANGAAPASQPNPSQAIPPPQASPLAIAPDNNAALKSDTRWQTAETKRPEFLPEPFSNGTGVAPREPNKKATLGGDTPALPISSEKSVNQDAQMAPRTVEEQSSGALPPWKPAAEANAKDPLSTETSSANKRTFEAEVAPKGQSVKSAPVPSVPREARARLTEPAFRVVNSQRIKLHFDVKDKGPAGIAGVELWFIHENREWKRPEARLQKQGPYVVEVDGEGLYGFKLIARNSQGGGEPPPQAGDPPQIWVLVDVTKPAVRIQAAKVVRDADGPALELSWTATDKNLGHRPVTLLYAEQPGGPWLPMVANLESTGTCHVKLPPTMPKRFLVRVEAIDIAGNVGADQTRAFLEAELAPSQVSILNVD